MAGSNFIKIGPAGVENGKPWDEIGKTEIVQILIWHTKTSIRSIQFQYSSDNKNPVFSDKHGGTASSGDLLFNLVRLDHPSEYITSISGHYNSSNLNLLKFGTNRGEYGPFGGRLYSPRSFVSYAGYEFNFQLGEKARQFGGFFGTANVSYLLSIGMYLRPIELLKSPPEKQAICLKIKEERKT